MMLIFSNSRYAVVTVLDVKYSFRVLIVILISSCVSLCCLSAYLCQEELLLASFLVNLTDIWLYLISDILLFLVTVRLPHTLKILRMRERIASILLQFVTSRDVI